MNVHMEEISMDVIEELGNYSVDISKTIEEELSCIVPNNLQEASIYLTKAGGKMLRPALTLITSEAVGGSRDNSLKSAAAIELIHTFSLIHDDIMDDDDMRRGKPAVHKVWDENVAILAGDTLFSKGMTLEKEVLAAQYMLLDRVENTSEVSQLLRENKIIVQERNFLTALVYNEAKDTKEVQFVQEARRIIPQAAYTQIWGAFQPKQLDNYFKLRLDESSQWEIRMVSKAMQELINGRK